LHVLLASLLPSLRQLFSVAPPPARPAPPEIVTVSRLSVEPRRAVRPQRLVRAAQAAPRAERRRLATLPRPLPPRTLPLERPRAPVATRHELAKALPRSRPQAAASRVAFARPAQAAAPRAVRGRQQLSEQTLAHVEDDLGAAIRQDRTGIDPLNVPQDAPVPAPTRFGPDYGSFELGGHGLCDPIKDWTDAGWDYYFVSCNMHLDDGSVERQPVPWPVRFPPGADPFAGTLRHDVALPLPLPGWHLPSGETVSEQLREYASAHGVNI
jgi:hypothetical protein